MAFPETIFTKPSRVLHFVVIVIDFFQTHQDRGWMKLIKKENAMLPSPKQLHYYYSESVFRITDYVNYNIVKTLFNLNISVCMKKLCNFLC